MPNKLSKKLSSVSKVKLNSNLMERLKVQKEAREYAEEIIATVREPLIVLDVDLKVILANQNFYQTFRVNPKETIGRFVYDLGNRQWDIPKLRLLLEKILPENVAFDNFEVRHNFESIGQKTMLLNARRIPRPPRKTKIILLAIEDITTRKKAELKVLEASELRYRRLFETAQDGILLVDFHTGMIVSVNPFLINLLGYSEKEFITKYLWEIGIFKDIVASKKKFLILQTKKYVRFENLPLETKDGKEIAVEFVANAYKVNGETIIQCNIRDITDRKQIEEKLKASELKYSTLVEKGNDGILIIQDDGILKYANSRICEITGYTEEEVVEKPFINYVSSKYKETVAKRYKKRLKDDYALSKYEIEIVSRKGERTPVEINFSRINYEGKLAIMAIVRDITDRKLIDQAKDDFLSIAAHDLRTPMSEIRVNTEMILAGDYGKISPKFKEPLQDIDKANLSLIKMVDDFLTISRIEKGKIKIILRPIDIKLVLDNAAKHSKLIAKRRGLGFDYEVPAKMPQVMADSDKVSEVFNNLLDNAIKFTDKGSIAIRVMIKEDSVVVAITDTGIGMTGEQQKRLFRKYAQAGVKERVTYGKGTGLGLGLYISRRIIEGCKGKIWVKSKPGIGSTFYLSLPIVKFRKNLNNNWRENGKQSRTKGSA